ncbi:ubiquitin fusion degradation protein [Tritrichomonas foetus]|uniref:Ubiquitin fusion degradation protein n=1 Tax=Tritrichomonas foetus TaxID=1144522 RepID=A0A1J4KGH0_9EUKA|nr:ubiquitin fusion degradation protein [Tritrichomonas foetus]|eukprot:OHT10315.1 ubiquitin fusion degradation protein [Tritrichomonas foetus]
MANQFTDNFRCHSSAYYNKPELEQTGRILLPDSALNDIYQRNINVPEVMLFSIRNTRLGIVVYAGVESFTTHPGQACVPYWMMEYLQVNEGEIVQITLTTLPTATRALFQPQDSTFFNIPNPKVVLEFTLRRHPCLTQGTMIPINFNNKSYKLKVLKTEPNRAVQIHRADVICDFATPVSEFDHHWNESDTDSSDDEETVRIRKGKTLTGKVFEEHPKPLHSTYAQREYDRLHGNVFKTTEIVAGQEILPPKPREKEMKGKAKKDMFAGQGHVLKRTKKGAKGDQKKEDTQNHQQEPEKSPFSTQNLNRPESQKKSFFSGTGRSMKGETVPGAPMQGNRAQSAMAKQPEPVQENKQAEQKKSYFSGTGRTMKDAGPPQRTQQSAPPQQNTTTNTNNNNGGNAGGSSFFRGTGRSMK